MVFVIASLDTSSKFKLPLCLFLFVTAESLPT
ncbi:hypothetical protein T11_10117 [Trichinella zimbabwensis]|uniref:Uncharacterized protein n=1 Tax=Trichinella zimbabwensis TaxID=268475 RepID=A0A0V1G7D7_9BILA|nr:hypothetical protein T11_10117 [Trichinella zimbabwensis]